MLQSTVLQLTAVLACLGTVAAYFLYATKPGLPSGPVEINTLSLSGQQRRYTVFSPSQLQAGASVVLALHPSRSSGEHMRRIVGNTLERIAQRDNVVIVYPDGYEGHFNDCRRAASYSARTLNIDDIGFIKQIIEHLVRDKQVDPQRVYAIGYSNGGQMALRLALESPEVVKGVAAIAANLPTADNMDCNVAPSPARYIELIEGTQDPINPYAGGAVTLFGFGHRGNVLSAHESAQWFATILGLTTSQSQTQKTIAGISVQQEEWRSHDAHVRLTTLKGAGHTVPQAGYRFMRILGATLQSDSVLESTWQLFKTHTP